MNVVLVSDHECEGGAAVAASRLADSLTLCDQVSRVVFFPPSRLPQQSTTQVCYSAESFLTRQFYRLPRKLWPRRFPRPGSPAFAADRLRRILEPMRADVINVHNLHGAAPWGWGPHLLDVCLEFAPVVWTLHDMWSFTGRCAYSYDCEKFISGCDASCPTPHEEPKMPRDQIQDAWEERRALYARHRQRLTIVTPSRWLAEQSRRSLFAQHRVEVIPNGLPLGADSGFVPTLREDARRSLGIATAGPVLLVAAFDLSERRKGADILPALWKQIRQRPITIVTMGRGDLRIDEPDIRVHSLGWIEDDAKKALAYSAADALLHPAPVDNLPNVVVEALACGTPTIAMPVGGVPELVRPGVTGWLASTPTALALAHAADAALHDLALGVNLRGSCRQVAESEYDVELQGRRYLELFGELLNGRKAAIMTLPEKERGQW